MMFAAITFLSAFLLFVVEPMLGKHLLPWFGGTPAVWTTCMLFFQILLLLGYLYAHLTDRYLSIRAQGRLHAALLLVSVLALGWFALKWGAPLLPGSAWRPASPDAPIAHILLVMTAAVGLPFFLLSATSPLIQRWYAVVRQESFPYRLYALSNAGSLIGLLSYPFVLEPAASMPVQAALWTACYACFAAPCALVALRLPATPSMAASPAALEGRGVRPSATTIALWFMLATCASAMLLSVTNSLCQEVAAVPFLWVVPLALYLLTFILCFQNPRGYAREWYLPLTALLTLAVLMTHMLGVQLRIPAHVLSFSLFLFAFCMTCHGELVRLRPSSRYLTLFYLAAAAGGAAGGVFVGVVAPYGFSGFREFHISVLAGWVALLVVLGRDPTSPLFTGDRRHAAAVLFIAVYVALRYLLPAFHAGRVAGSARALDALHMGLALAIAGALIAAAWRRPWMKRRLWPRILIGLVLFMSECFLLHQTWSERLFSRAQTRNFYGVLRVDEMTADASGVASRNLIHGHINHGFQLLADEWRRRPVGYYVPDSGVGLAMRFHPRRTGAVPQPFRIGVTGLGAGGLAAYAATNDVIRFYEINPAVIEYSAGPKAFFTYVSECAGKVEIVTGDARLSQERELRESGSERYDVLVLDAFSSDSVPVHLLTMEALGVCLAHLRDENAILAVNISNRFLDLRPLMFAQARRLGLEAGLFRCAGAAPQPTMSLWVLMTRNRAFFDQAEVRAKRMPYQPSREIVWTDSYSGLFRLLRFD